MRKSPPLQRFDSAVEAFISSRRALGRASRVDEYVLRRLRSYLARAGYSDLDSASFAGWRRRLRHCSHNTQLDWTMMVVRFCRYRRRRESRCFSPQRWTLGRRRPYSLPTPIAADEVRRLLDFVAGCPPIAGRPLAHAAHRLAIVLLYTAGLRRGEAAQLRIEDVDAESGVVRVCGSKFHKSRWVPLSPSAAGELIAYLRARAAVIPRAAHNPMLLCSRASRGYTTEGLSSAVRGAMSRSGIWAQAPRLPRVHDFRHNSGSRIIPSAGRDYQKCAKTLGVGAARQSA